MRTQLVKKIALALMLLLGVTSLARAQIGPGGVSSPGSPQQIIQVAKSGARFTTICGATCTSATSTCVAGSALASFSDSSVNKPYTIQIGPGVYNECIAVDNRSYVTLIGSGVNATIIRPSVTAAGDIVGGVIKIAEATTTTGSTHHIEIADMTVWDDAFGGTAEANAAIMVGRGNIAAATAASWQDVLIRNVRLIGDDDGIAVAGSRLSADTNVPRLRFRDSIAIGGTVASAFRGLMKLDAQNLDLWSDSNYCESTNATLLAQRSGTAAGGSAPSATGSYVTLDPNESTTPLNFYIGRKVTLADADGGGAGTCGTANGAVGQFWADAFDPNTQQLGLTAQPGADPTSGCSYVIDAVANAAAASCTDVDWTTIRGGSCNTGGGSFGSSCYGAALGIGTAGFAAGTVVAAAPDDSYYSFKSVRIKVDVNDFGPTNAACSSNQTLDSTAAGIKLAAYRYQDVIFDNVDETINLNVDMIDGTTCATRLYCLGLTGNSIVEGAVTYSGRCTINNAGDADTDSEGFVSNSSGAGDLRILEAFLTINNTVGSYVGTRVHLLQSGTSTFKLGKAYNGISGEAFSNSGTQTSLNTSP